MSRTKRNREVPAIAGILANAVLSTVAKAIQDKQPEPPSPEEILRNYKDAKDTLEFTRRKVVAGIKDPEMSVFRAENLWRQARRDAAEVLRSKSGGKMKAGGCVYHLHTEYDREGRVVAHGISVHRKLRKGRRAPFLVNEWRRHGIAI